MEDTVNQHLIHCLRAALGSDAINPPSMLVRIHAQRNLLPDGHADGTHFCNVSPTSLEAQTFSHCLVPANDDEHVDPSVGKLLQEYNAHSYGEETPTFLAQVKVAKERFPFLDLCPENRVQELLEENHMRPLWRVEMNTSTSRHVDPCWEDADWGTDDPVMGREPWYFTSKDEANKEIATFVKDMNKNTQGGYRREGFRVVPANKMAQLEQDVEDMHARLEQLAAKVDGTLRSVQATLRCLVDDVAPDVPTVFSTSPKAHKETNNK